MVNMFTRIDDLAVRMAKVEDMAGDAHERVDDTERRRFDSRETEAQLSTRLTARVTTLEARMVKVENLTLTEHAAIEQAKLVDRVAARVTALEGRVQEAWKVLGDHMKPVGDIPDLAETVARQGVTLEETASLVRRVYVEGGDASRVTELEAAVAGQEVILNDLRERVICDLARPSPAQGMVAPAATTNTQADQ